MGAQDEDSAATGINGNQGNSPTFFNCGAAYVFVREGTNWSQQAYLKASNTGSQDFFGSEVSIWGDTVAVSATSEQSNATGVNGNQNNDSVPFAGAVYVFVRNGTNWSQQAYLKASNTGQDDRFGGALAISRDTIVVGSLFESSNATGINGDQSNNSALNSGAAYVFVRTGTNWSQQAYLKASNAQAQDRFGISVTVSEDTVLVGATEEDSSATGVNGNQADNSFSASGAAYLFTRHGTIWTQRAYLKASNSEASDVFGNSVALAGGTAVIGGWREDSSAIGVNGNQTDNNARTSGAAYVFTGVGVGPRLGLVPGAEGGYLLRLNGAPFGSYRLQSSPTANGPWDTIATITLPASGYVEHHDVTPPPGQAFYRSVQP